MVGYYMFFVFFKSVLQTSVPYNVASDCHRSAIWRTVKKEFVLVSCCVIVSLKTYKLIKSNFQILMAYKCDDVTLNDFKGQCTWSFWKKTPIPVPISVSGFLQLLNFLNDFALYIRRAQTY